MPKKTLPRIKKVSTSKSALRLHIMWLDGGSNVVDISEIVHTFKVYAPLRSDSVLFQKAHIGEYSSDVVWTDEIDISANTLWRLAQEQAGTTMAAEAFRRWRESRGYTLEGAAQALGLSRRTVAYYEQGGKPIPRIVALATRGLNTLATGNSNAARGVLNNRAYSIEIIKEWSIAFQEQSMHGGILKPQVQAQSTEQQNTFTRGNYKGKLGRNRSPRQAEVAEVFGEERKEYVSGASRRYNALRKD